ncbi:E3 ubiquitin-protein ligase MGRN1 [Seriola lalandi dorsalis]|uniref:E3 ubiquitin-protein ligase MGRN1 n=1 Tax=Seriola lalandi dorsalis TaxID=1841481 RepID=UPI000C6F7B30|nr:E3 ubiquitin-protein ligase MGRN1 [Seriola lalandi dorsalis]
MGSILSRRIAGVEDIDIQANSAYRFPPKSGNYFASHFFMGGEKFDTPHPEGYLFGENMDLNFLGNRPVQFPYVTPAPHEPVKTLRSLVNIRKDSLRLVRYKDDSDTPVEDGEKPKVQYGVEFTFDADARVAITLYCQAFEEFSNGMAVYSPKDPSMVSETVHYKRGVSQQFSMPSFKIDFSEWKEEDLNFDLDRGVFPMVIQAVVDEGDDCLGHAHVLLAAFERHVDGSFSVKPLKQKQIVDRVSYLLQEIYGIENKNNQETKPSDDENSDNSNECVVCLSDLRVCIVTTSVYVSLQGTDSVPPGFEPISLLEALNGLRSVSPAIPSAPLYDEINFSGGLGGDSRQLSSPEHLSDGSLQKSKVSKSPDSTLRSPSSPIQEEDEEKLSEMSDAQPHTLLSSSPAPTDATATEDVAESLSPDDEDRMHSGGDILQDCSSEHSSLTKTESDPPGDLSLPGSSESTESLKSQSTNCSSQPLLCPTSSLHMEDEHLNP